MGLPLASVHWRNFRRLLITSLNDPVNFWVTGLEKDTSTTYGDITDYNKLFQSITQFQPDLILHLAAQLLVRRSYREPVRTFLVNTQGTAHVIEAGRSVKSVKGILCITTDKVYKNNEMALALSRK